MKKNDPIIQYIITWLTLGLYAPIWSLKMARDINGLTTEEKIETKNKKIIFGLLYPVYLIGTFWTMFQFQMNIMNGDYTSPGVTFYVLFLVGIIIMVLLVRLNLQISNAIGSIAPTKELGSVAVVALTLIYFIAFPMLQSKLNKLIEHNQPREDNSE